MKHKKTFALVQPGYIYGNEKKSAYLPYAAGTLAAFALSQPEIAQRYAFSGFFCFFDAYDAVLAKLEHADVVGFSNYVWNYQYNCELARRLKQRNPGCTVLFGGHQISEKTALATPMPFVDIFVYGEGETAFAAVLKALAEGCDFSGIPGIVYRTGSGEITATGAAPCTDRAYPSPYLMGLFDPLLEQYPEISFTALFETNRGCPFKCAYCDWGTTKDRVRMFPLERVFGEIQWFSQHKIEICFAADANFGLFERDAQIAQMLIDAKEKTGYPLRFEVTYAKSDDPRVIGIAGKLFRAGMSNGPAVSFQSLNPATLEAIGRKNLSVDAFVKAMKRYEEEGLHPYTELILGLPEETLASFTKGIGRLIALGQQSYIDVFRCEMLANAALSTPAMRKKYRIQTVTVPSSLHHVNQKTAQQCFGESEIVVATSSMPFDDMLKANLFSMTVQACHFMGLTKYIAVYLFREHDVAYEDFYMRLTDFLAENNKNAAEMKSVYASYLRGEGELGCTDPAFGDINWFPEEAFFLKSVKQRETFYRCITPLVSSYIGDKDLAKQLLDYQSMFAVVPDCTEKRMRFSYDFYRFFQGQTRRLLQKPCHIRIVTPLYGDWPECATKTVWYGRRRSLTDAFVSAEVYYDD